MAELKVIFTALQQVNRAEIEVHVVMSVASQAFAVFQSLRKQQRMVSRVCDREASGQCRVSI